VIFSLRIWFSRLALADRFFPFIEKKGKIVYHNYFQSPLNRVNCEIFNYKTYEKLKEFQSPLYRVNYEIGMW
jgi:hypothetical protein